MTVATTAAAAAPTQSIAPAVDYLPVDPQRYHPAIGLIGCGGISAKHLAAYRKAGYNVVALCDLNLASAEARRDEFCPSAAVTADHHELLAREDIEIVDIATHVDVRPALVADAIAAGKHVLSQKPFVRDFDIGDDLIDRAAAKGTLLAVNQNGRWAPHFAYLLAATKQGIIGEVVSGDFTVYWGHDRDLEGHPVFSVMPDLILYDFGIHWFDVISRLLSAQGQAVSVFATVGTRPGQRIAVPTQAQVIITFENAVATLVLRGGSPLLEQGGYRVEGTGGVITHSGLSLGGDSVRLVTADLDAKQPLEGDWWDNGMHGAMAEVMLAIEEGREASNDARYSLPGLALCFAAIESSRSGVAVDPRTIRRVPS